MKLPPPLRIRQASHGNSRQGHQASPCHRGVDIDNRAVLGKVERPAADACAIGDRGISAQQAFEDAGKEDEKRVGSFDRFRRAGGRNRVHHLLFRSPVLPAGRRSHRIHTENPAARRRFDLGAGNDAQRDRRPGEALDVHAQPSRRRFSASASACSRQVASFSRSPSTTAAGARATNCSLPSFFSCAPTSCWSCASSLASRAHSRSRRCASPSGDEDARCRRAARPS